MITFTKAVRHLQTTSRRLERAKGERALRNARTAFLQELAAVRVKLDEEYPVQRRVKKGYERVCKCGHAADQHVVVGQSRVCAKAGCFGCKTYTPAALKLTETEKLGRRVRSMKKRGYEQLLRQGMHITLCAQLGVKVEVVNSLSWAPSWINELPAGFDTEHFTKSMGRRARKDIAFRKQLLAELAMKRRQGVVI